jgi:ABC-type transport system substrate-binding protein
VAPDGLTYTFTLNDGVKWQNLPPVNARPFTAADVKFAWDRYAAGGAQKAYWAALDRIDVNGDSTVIVKLKRPSPDFLIPVASRYLTMHPHEIVDDGSIERQPIGTGPMIFKEGKVDQHVVMERNADYFRGPVPLDGIEFRIMPDVQARLNALRVGQVDHAQTVIGGLRDLEALLKTNADVQVMTAEPLFAAFQYTFNLESPKWQDIRVRRAVQMGIDRKAIVQVVNDNNGAVVTAIPWSFLFDDIPTSADVLGPWWDYKPEQAKQLLQAAGAEDLSFDCIWYPYTESSNTRPNAQVVDQLRAVGVTMTTQQLEYTQFNSQWTTVKYDDVVDGWSANGFTADTYFSEQLHSGSPNNRSRGLSDPQIDEWADAQSSELDAQKRKEFQRKIWDRVQDQVWRVDKPAAKGYEVLQPWVRNVSFTGPFNANYSFTELAAPSQLERAWLDK